MPNKNELCQAVSLQGTKNDIFHLLNLTDKRLLSLRTPMVKTGQIGRCQGFEKLEEM